MGFADRLSSAVAWCRDRLEDLGTAGEQRMVRSCGEILHEFASVNFDRGTTRLFFARGDEPVRLWLYLLTIWGSQRSVLFGVGRRSARSLAQTLHQAGDPLTCSGARSRPRVSAKVLEELELIFVGRRIHDFGLIAEEPHPQGVVAFYLSLVQGSNQVWVHLAAKYPPGVLGGGWGGSGDSLHQGHRSDWLAYRLDRRTARRLAAALDGAIAFADAQPIEW